MEEGGGVAPSGAAMTTFCYCDGRVHQWHGKLGSSVMQKVMREMREEGRGR